MHRRVSFSGRSADGQMNLKGLLPSYWCVWSLVPGEIASETVILKNTSSSRMEGDEGTRNRGEKKKPG